MIFDIMATKRFHLMGEDPLTAQDIELPSLLDEQGLQHLVASHFAIVDPNDMPLTID
jgi:hypothetical protein